MDKQSKFRWGYVCGLAFLALVGWGAVPAIADTGDIYRVTAEKVNLRAGPSNEADVRTTVEAGDELIELQKRGSWLGIRMLGTGEEGWIYEDLVERVSQSFLRQGATAVPFDELSEGFGSLLDNINNHLGYRLVDRVERIETNTLRVTPTQEWLLYASREAHLMAALALYQMWKNHQDGRSVSLLVVDPQNENYITINDEESGPVLSVQESRSSKTSDR